MLKVSYVSIIVVGNAVDIRVKTGVIKVIGINTGIIIILLY